MNSQASDDIKLLFIEEELSQFGEELCDALSDAITKQKLKLKSCGTVKTDKNKRSSRLIWLLLFASFNSGIL